MHVDSDVHDFETRAFGHHAHKVFADVMKVATNSAHQQTPGRDTVGILRSQERFQHGHPGFHRAGGDEDFRDVENVIFKIFPNDAHAGDQAFGEHFLDAAAFRQRGASHRLDFLGFAFVKALIH
jgi:hypothetical protein